MKKYKIYLLSFSILAVILGGCAPKKTNTAIDVNNMDLSVKPGDDFFRYVNGNYLKTLEIPDDKTSYNVFNILRENADRDINNILKEVSNIEGAEKGSAAQQISDFYYTGMNIEEINKVGIKALDKEFKMIDDIETLGQFQDMVAYMHLNGLDPFFGGSVMQDLADNTKLKYYLGQSGTGLPDVEYYYKEDDRSKEIRTEYVKYISKMLGFTGEDGPQASKWAKTIMRIETFMAKNAKTRLEMRNIPGLYNLMSIDSVQTLIPDFDMERYFSKISDQDFGDLVVTDPKYFSALGNLMAQNKLEDLKIYLKWNLLNRSANFLSDAIVNQRFQFYAAFLSGSKQIQDRWKRVTQMTNAMMGEQLGQLYVEKHFPPSSKEKMSALVANLKVALKHRLETLTWMSEETRASALEKLANMRVKIGYPDKWDDYTALVIERDSYLENVRRVSYFETQKNLKKFNEPIDPDEWPMTPQTVNAGYSPLKNDITFPAGILQPPYFNPDADDAVNYGAIGVVIGHEMTHGFDDQGRNFNKDGVMTNWWTEEDSKEFTERAQLLIDQYGAFKVNEEVNIDGHLSLGENIADFGGLTISLEAYHNSMEGKNTPADIDGFNHMQRFFISYGQIWRGKIREKALIRKVKEDVHPWGEYRVNGAPFNVPEFYETFDINPKDELYRTIEQRPVIW